MNKNNDRLAVPVASAEKGLECNSSWTRSALIEAIQKYHVTKYKWSALEGTVYSKHRKAAVLIPLVIHDGVIHVWLTKRSDKVGADKGHVSFPGGMKDAEDKDEVDTCLRESHEEVGLLASQVEIIAQLHPRLNAREILVTPVIGIVNSDFQPKANCEVAVVFKLPFDRFLKSRDLTFQDIEFEGLPYKIPFFSDDVDGDDIVTWGLTAFMCIELAVAVLQKETQYDFFQHSKLYPSDPFVLSRTYLEVLGYQKVLSHL